MKKFLLILFLLATAQLYASVPSVLSPASTSHHLVPPDEYVTHAEAGIKILVPSGWKQDKEDNILVINSPDGGVEVFYLVVNAHDLREAAELIDESIQSVIRDAVFEEHVDELDLDGMHAVSLDGVGIDDETNQKVELNVTIVQCPKNDKYMFLVAAGLPASLKKNEPALVKIFSGIKKATGF